jgi:hypothetical protein
MLCGRGVIHIDRRLALIRVNVNSKGKWRNQEALGHCVQVCLPLCLAGVGVCRSPKTRLQVIPRIIGVGAVS